jgi:hypothetical protein
MADPVFLVPWHKKSDTQLVIRAMIMNEVL